MPTNLGRAPVTKNDIQIANNNEAILVVPASGTGRLRIRPLVNDVLFSFSGEEGQPIVPGYFLSALTLTAGEWFPIEWDRGATPGKGLYFDATANAPITIEIVAER